MTVAKSAPRIGGRRVTRDMASAPDDMGPLGLLPGRWRGEDAGWNMIALPFGEFPEFRVLMNRYREDLRFFLVDDGIPNRGLLRPGATEADQELLSLDYEQVIHQLIAEDFPVSGEAGDPGLAIHHEPGLWLHMKNLRTEDLDSGRDIDVARLATIPHGNSVLAPGQSAEHCGMPEIPPISGLPFGRFEDITSGDYDVHSDPYLAPYKHFIDNPFRATDAFPGFSPVDMNALLRLANDGVDIERTTTLTVDSTLQRGGIVNIPFVVREAEPVAMRSTFWIQELAERDPYGKPKLRLQYSQVVVLDFFRPRQDELPGRARWPHVSINTLEKVDDSTED